jgi:PIN domain nuclease of toxin-antitoxin system
LGLESDAATVPEQIEEGRPATPVILLDTNALIWVVRHHPRVRRLIGEALPLHISPLSLLELQLLAESGRVRLDIQRVIHDDRWRLDEASPLDWFIKAAEESWTRDPFDRLIVAHARLRGWRLATADGEILDRLRVSERYEL